MLEDAAAGRQAGQGKTHGQIGGAGQVRPGARPQPPGPDHPRIGGPPHGTGPRAGLRGQLCRYFVSPPWTSGRAKNFQYGSQAGQHVADKTQPGSLGAVGYDDEGVKTKRWDIIKEGMLVNYQAIRDQAHMMGQNESHGCCYADNWSSVQFQRMPNVIAGSPGTRKVLGGRHGEGRGQRHLHCRPRFVLHRPAALQLPVWRHGVLRDQKGQDRGHARRRGLPGQHPGILELLLRHLRRKSTTACSALSSTARASPPR